MIILKEAMNMNAAQHCVHNVFAFPSNREHPKIVSRSRISFERPQSMPNLVQDQYDYNQRLIKGKNSSICSSVLIYWTSVLT